jgi:hypothetical protein
MLLKGIVAATASLALMVAPTVAAAQASQVNPSYEQAAGLQLGDDDDDGTGIFWIFGVGIAIGLAIWLLTKGDDDDNDAPVSP